ncbi:MAG: hypothetical protein GDA43_07870 [Hormoscilla sp. SP5CHS1]|nr:hypothetical protein [Hormoscilla sp. SP5CHS1]
MAQSPRLRCEGLLRSPTYAKRSLFVKKIVSTGKYSKIIMVALAIKLWKFNQGRFDVSFVEEIKALNNNISQAIKYWRDDRLESAY